MLISPRVKNKLVIDYLLLKPRGNALFIFNHGLGDFINFLPLFQKLKNEFPAWHLNIGTNKKFSDIYPIIPFIHGSDVRRNLRVYDYIFNITYPEPPNINYISKPYYCNELEIGLKNFKWSPIRLSNTNKIKSNLIGIHFFGNTNQKNKSIGEDLAEQIWNDIVKLDYVPFEIHNNKYNKQDNIGCSFIKSSQSLRFENPNLKKFIEKISECEYFLGVDSGPLYLAGSILGLDRCVGLEKNYLFDKYLPYQIDKVDVNNYKFYKLKLILKRKEKNEKIF